MTLRIYTTKNNKISKFLLVGVKLFRRFKGGYSFKIREVNRGYIKRV
jgi:hypothetical protein